MSIQTAHVIPLMTHCLGIRDSGIGHTELTNYTQFITREKGCVYIYISLWFFKESDIHFIGYFTNPVHRIKPDKCYKFTDVLMHTNGAVKW